MTNLELVLNMLAKSHHDRNLKRKAPSGFEQNRKIAKQGGTIAGNTRKKIELKTGKPIVSAKNAKQLK